MFITESGASCLLHHGLQRSTARWNTLSDYLVSRRSPGFHSWILATRLYILCQCLVGRASSCFSDYHSWLSLLSQKSRKFASTKMHRFYFSHYLQVKLQRILLIYKEKVQICWSFLRFPKLYPISFISKCFPSTLCELTYPITFKMFPSGWNHSPPTRTHRRIVLSIM